MSFSLQRQQEISHVLRFRNLPYNPFRKSLYTVDELMRGYTPNAPEQSLDARIAQHFLKKNQRLPDVHEALAQRLHDHAIDSALYRFVNPKGLQAKKVVGVMGSHSTARGSADYLAVARISWLLSKRGFCIVTGGGPGIMEAANLGAYFALQPDASLADAIRTLSAAPVYADNERAYIAAATTVRHQYKDSGLSLAIPTWAYSDEPTGQFSSRIGKYFSNSIREDGLLAVAAWGVVFAPGSAGTLQEIFQDAAHNSYWSFHSRGPMVFFNRSFFSGPPSIYDVLRDRAHKDKYDNMVGIFDMPEEVVEFVVNHPMVPESTHQSTFGLTSLTLDS